MLDHLSVVLPPGHEGPDLKPLSPGEEGFPSGRAVAFSLFPPSEAIPHHGPHGVDGYQDERGRWAFMARRGCSNQRLQLPLWLPADLQVLLPEVARDPWADGGVPDEGVRDSLLTASRFVSGE